MILQAWNGVGPALEHYVKVRGSGRHNTQPASPLLTPHFPGRHRLTSYRRHRPPFFFLQERDVDLCVCGARSASFFRRTVGALFGLGSVSEYLVRRLQCPVVVVRDKAAKAGAADAGGEPSAPPEPEAETGPPAEAA